MKAWIIWFLQIFYKVRRDAKCRNGEHEWELAETEYSRTPLPTRSVHFVCNFCKKEYRAKRQAFVEGSGALTHFLGRDWF